YRAVGGERDLLAGRDAVGVGSLEQHEVGAAGPADVGRRDGVRDGQEHQGARGGGHSGGDQGDPGPSGTGRADLRRQPAHPAAQEVQPVRHPAGRQADADDAAAAQQVDPELERGRQQVEREDHAGQAVDGGPAPGQLALVGAAEQQPGHETAGVGDGPVAQVGDVDVAHQGDVAVQLDEGQQVQQAGDVAAEGEEHQGGLDAGVG